MNIRYGRSKKSVKASKSIRKSIHASTDYATLMGMDFSKARDILTKDGFHEHEYGDKDDNNGYAVYRKGDKEVELQYRWNAGKRKNEYHAGKVTNVYVDDDINGACGKKSVKASTKIEWEVVDDCTDDDGTIGSYGTKVDGEFYWVSLNENGKWDIEKEYSYGIASLGSKFENFKTAKAAQRFFENYIDDLAEEDDDGIESACGKKSVKASRRPVKAARTLDIYTWEELTPEQQDYVIQNWSDMRKLADVIYEWYNDDIMFAYQDEKQYIADKYANQYGLSINPDKLYWQSNSHGPYPEWDLSQVFDEYQLNDGTEIYFYGRGLDVEAETDSWGEEVESPEIDEVVGHAQEYIDEMWKYINDVCQAYPDDEWVEGTFESNPDAFEFIITDSGEVKYY